MSLIEALIAGSFGHVEKNLLRAVPVDLRII